MCLSRPWYPHFPFFSVQMPSSTALAYRPCRTLLFDSERATTSPYSPLPCLAIPEHRRSPTIVGLRRVTAILPCS
jgi:hypothetical protein